MRRKILPRKTACPIGRAKVTRHKVPRRNSILHNVTRHKILRHCRLRGNALASRALSNGRAKAARLGPTVRLRAKVTRHKAVATDLRHNKMDATDLRHSKTGAMAHQRRLANMVRLRAKLQAKGPILMRPLRAPRRKPANTVARRIRSGPTRARKNGSRSL